ncbi:DUF4276 family protein [Devosia sp. A16]|uniref:DUF4276 family protein n=1 Tax=Devosia sp. A16 TaxID=1736675 RepID=UPI0009EB13B9|nr:DUF4276 family protein [Devosia sp. A16]
MIHLEVLVEDASGATALQALLPKVTRPDWTFTIHSFRGIGRLPAGLKPASDAAKRILLDQLPRLLRGYGRAFAGDPPEYTRVVVLVCDLDDRPKASFEAEIRGLVDSCNPKPHALICLAIEEGEAWLLSDEDAVIEAYSKADRQELGTYVPDSICGTWEKLADVVYPGGSRALRKLGYQAVGAVKHEWAENIAPRVVPARNKSPSFQALIAALSGLEADA